MSYVEISANDISANPFKLIGSDWMLITAGNEKNYNTMTASWGGVGVLWNKNVAFSFVRPQRYTLEFLEREDYFTLSFFNDKYKSALSFCGSHSGRDVNKTEQTGLTPNFSEDAPFFDEAKLVLVCKKVYGQFLTPESFIDLELEKNYSNKDYHKMFIGEIVKVLVKD